MRRLDPHRGSAQLVAGRPRVGEVLWREIPASSLGLHVDLTPTKSNLSLPTLGDGLGPQTPST